MFLKKAILFSILLGFITACSGDKNEGKDLKLYVSSFIKQNSNVVAFGSAEIKSILNKTDYKSNDKLDVLLSGELSKIDHVLDINSPVFFVAEGPFKSDGSPEALHIFIKVKNEDSLLIELNERSFDVNKSGKINYTEDGDFVMGIQNDLAIVTIKGSNEYKAKDLVASTFKMAQSDPNGGTVDEILNLDGDMVFGMHLANLYETSDTDLNKLDVEKQKEIKEMMSGAFIQTVFKFENGSAIIESKNIFSEKLKNELFFRSDNSSKIVNKLDKGSGLMIAGVSVNIDMNKLEKFYAKYSPETLENVTSGLGLAGGVFSLMGSENILSKLSDGQFGATVIGNPMANTFGVNAFFGATETGKSMFAMFEKSIPVDLNYAYKNDGIYGTYSVFAGSDSDKTSSVKLPKGCDVFGKKGITAFVNFDGIELEDFGFSGPQKLLEIVKYATFEYNEDGGRLVIKAKDGQENILKQAMGILIDELSSEIGGMAI
jgi:hypothetical protein